MFKDFLLVDSPTKLMSLVGSVGTRSGRVWCTRTSSPRVDVGLVVVVDDVDVVGGAGDVAAGCGKIGSGGL